MRITVHPDTYVDSVVQLSGHPGDAPGGRRGLGGRRDGHPGQPGHARRRGLRASTRWPRPGRTTCSWRSAAAPRTPSRPPLEAAEAAMFAPRRGAGADRAARPARTLGEALDRAPASNVAVISVPGDYAALEAHKALSAGLARPAVQRQRRRGRRDRAEGAGQPARPAGDGAGRRHRDARAHVPGLRQRRAARPGRGGRRGRHRRPGGGQPGGPLGRRRLARDRAGRARPERGGRRSDGAVRGARAGRRPRHRRDPAGLEAALGARGTRRGRGGGRQAAGRGVDRGAGGLRGAGRRGGHPHPGGRGGGRRAGGRPGGAGRDR